MPKKNPEPKDLPEGSEPRSSRSPKEVSVTIKGHVFEKDTMFFREAVGSAQGAPGYEYELTLNLGGMVPTIRSKKSGRWFTLPWRSMLAAAVEAGIDEDV